MAEGTTGARVVGAYDLEKLLGEGGMGVVWGATDRRTGARVAVKVLHASAADSELMRKRFLREARAAMAVAHPNIVRIREVLHADIGPAIVMDLLEGETLAARLSRARPIPVAEFTRIFLQVVSAVGTAHAHGVVHRDLKPENIFLVRRAGADPEVRVLDFGVAKLTAREGEAQQTAALTGEGAMLGTPYYMAPEQVFGDKGLDHRADVWALGVIMYECLGGRRPFEGERAALVLRAVTRGEATPLAAIAPHLPEELTALHRRMMSVDPAARPSDLREVYEIVRPFTDVRADGFAAPTLPGDDVAAIATAPTEMADGAAASARTAPPRRRALARWAIAVSLLGLGGVAAVVTRRSPQSELPVAARAPQAPEIPTSAPLAPSASFAASATAPPAPPVATALPRPAVPRVQAPRPSAKPAVAPSASSAPPPASIESKRLPGGLANEVPRF